MPPCITENELDRLEQYLNAPNRIDSTLALDSVQGLFAAVTSGAAPIDRAMWLPEVLGSNHTFANPEEAAEITGLLERFRDEVARQLTEAEGFDFILYGPEDGEEDLSGWAEGYLMGVDLADPPWEDSVDAEDLDSMLFPFMALTGQAKELALEEGEEWMSDEDEARMLAEIREGLANHLIDVRKYWLDKGSRANA